MKNGTDDIQIYKACCYCGFRAHWQVTRKYFTYAGKNEAQWKTIKQFVCWEHKEKLPSTQNNVSVESII